MNVPQFSNAIYYLERHEICSGFPAWIIRHQKEVFLLAYLMGEVLGFNGEQLTDLSVAARFHDIGKTYMDPQIINSKGRLTQEQKFEIFKHVHQSYDILKKKGVSSKAILEGVFYHHENYDGTGYPDKLKADEIPLEAQILRIVDSFSAMLGSRPYHNRGRKDFEWALVQIEKNRGSLYSPKLTDIFLNTIRGSKHAFKKDAVNNSLHNKLFKGGKSS